MMDLRFDAAAFGDIPYLHNWLGAWMIESTHLNALVQMVEKVDLRGHLDAQQAAGKSRRGMYSYTTIENGLATVELRGTLMKHQASMSLNTSTVMTRSDLRALANDDSVERVALLIESPGGTAAGTMELGDEVAKLNAIKPVTAFIEDLGASAAYWVASQASAIYANKMAKVGSIGTYAVVQDYSAQAAQAGVKVHVVRAGDFKGMGTPGTEITAGQLQEFQRLIDGLNQQFLSAVATGRKMDLATVTALADGRAHLANDAKALGLIDGVMSYDEFTGMMSPISPPRKSENKPMSEKQAATASEIKAACVGISDEKAFQYLSNDLTVDDCRSFWMEELQTENASLKEQLSVVTKERDEAVERAEKASKAPGVEELETTTSTSSSEASATEAFNAIVDENLKAFGGNRAKATAAAVRANKELHRQMLAEANAA